MTPFEFDVNPFSGWDVDGDITTTSDLDPNVIFGPMGTKLQTVVWGCERPELLITETLAWHDRRTEDRADDNGIKQLTTGKDPTFDQRLLPLPACFIELFNPWQTPYSVQNSGASTPYQYCAGRR